MAPSVAPMQLLVSIVERGKGRELREHYRQFGLIHHNQAAGHGTAASHLLDALGFGTSERDIILTLGPKDTMLQLVYHLKDEDRSKLGTPWHCLYTEPVGDERHFGSGAVPSGGNETGKGRAIHGTG